MSAAKALYHRLVPQEIRNPLGLVRRRLTDRLRRLVSSRPLPPPSLLCNIQITPFLDEYLEVGERSAQSLESTLEAAGLKRSDPLRLLDFGCGSARTIRHFSNTRWQIRGCDVDAEAVEWAARALPQARFDLTADNPPLPYEALSFDVVLAISLFTHFSEPEQVAWAAELARVLGPRGVALISTLGPAVLPAFPLRNIEQNRQALRQRGFFFVEGGDTFNSRSAFHSAAGVARLFRPWFDLVMWQERGLDGFQDLVLLRKK